MRDGVDGTSENFGQIGGEGESKELDGVIAGAKRGVKEEDRITVGGSARIEDLRDHWFVSLRDEENENKDDL
jgi:hypothetical protein